MGLAPYGQEYSKETISFISKIKSNIVDIKEDGSIFLNQKYFKYTYGLRMIKENGKVFGLNIEKKKEIYKFIVTNFCNKSNRRYCDQNGKGDKKIN